MIRIRSNRANTSDDGWWMVQTTALPITARFFNVYETRMKDLGKVSLESNVLVT